jgi:hypothetical protein
MNGASPGPWTTIPAASIQRPITISGLTPTTIYGFQVQALGVLGYSDWSTTKPSSASKPSAKESGPILKSLRNRSDSSFFLPEWRIHRRRKIRLSGNLKRPLEKSKRQLTIQNVS